MKILVTGANGTVGKHLVSDLADIFDKHNVVGIGSKDYDLTNLDECCFALQNNSPDVVVHLAARVGGIQQNIADPVGFLEQNLAINTNFIHACYHHGVTKTIACLSTCIYPNRLPDDRYPMLEQELHNGPPAPTNFSYGIAKRTMAVHCDAYNSQSTRDIDPFTYITPCNLYSDADNHNGKRAHFITAALSKIRHAVLQGDDKIKLLGTGKPLRQFMYAGDLSRAICEMIKTDTYVNCNICPPGNMSIHDLATACLEATGNTHLKIEYSGNPDEDGQYRKDVSNELFMKTFPDFKFTPLADGIRKAFNG